MLAVRRSELVRRALPLGASGMPTDATLRIGTSGYVYRHWRNGVFYPAGLGPRDELPWYSGRFSTVELNNPFYRVPTPETFDRWREATPDDFLFAVKVNRVISHVRASRETWRTPSAGFSKERAASARSSARSWSSYRHSFSVDLARLDRFLSLLPGEERWVLEVRHPSWQTADVYEMLGRREVALCVPIGGRVRPDLVTTAPFTYLRFHVGGGPGGGFTDDELSFWAGKVRALAQSGKDVYAYFNNDREGHAVRDAARLRALLRCGPLIARFPPALVEPRLSTEVVAEH